MSIELIDIIYVFLFLVIVICTTKFTINFTRVFFELCSDFKYLWKNRRRKK